MYTGIVPETGREGLFALLLVILYRDFVINACMVRRGTIPFTGKFALSKILMVFYHSADNRSKVKPTVDTAFCHAIHIEISMTRGPEIDDTNHEDRGGPFVIVSHTNFYVQNVGKTFGNQTCRKFALPVQFHVFQMILSVCHYT
jgi:hypothetical protein